MSGFQSLDRAIEVLFAFSRETPRLTADELARIAGLPRGSVYRYINALLEHGLLERANDKGQFKLGYRLVYFQSSVEYENDIEDYALPLMEQIRQATSETVHLTRLRGHRAVDVRSLASRANVRVAPPFGQPVYLHAGANNKVILAFRPEREWEAVMSQGLPCYTENTITDGAALAAELRKIRREGFAVSDHEMHEGAWGAAAPIVDVDGHAIASIGVSGPIFRRTEELVHASVALLIEYAGHISSRLLGNNRTYSKNGNRLPANR